jgi:hypothetical protein
MQTTFKFHIYALLTDWGLILTQNEICDYSFLFDVHKWLEDDHIIGQNIQRHFMLYYD